MLSLRKTCNCRAGCGACYVSAGIIDGRRGAWLAQALAPIGLPSDSGRIPDAPAGFLESPRVTSRKDKFNVQKRFQRGAEVQLGRAFLCARPHSKAPWRCQP